MPQIHILIENEYLGKYWIGKGMRIFIEYSHDWTSYGMDEKAFSLSWKTFFSK